MSEVNQELDQNGAAGATGIPEGNEVTQEIQNPEIKLEGDIQPEQIDPYAKIESVEDAKKILSQRDQEYSDLKASATQKEEFIQKQKTLIGEARKIQTQYEKAKSDLSIANTKLKELKDDPYADRDAYANAVKDRDSKEQNAIQIQAIASENTVKSFIPNFESLLETEIPELLKQDGYTDTNVGQMKDNWRLDPQLSLDYGRRALLLRENNLLKSKTRKVKESKAKLADNIVNAQTLSSPTGGVPTSSGSGRDVYEMSEAELNAEYAMLEKQGKVTTIS